MDVVASFDTDCYGGDLVMDKNIPQVKWRVVAFATWLTVTLALAPLREVRAAIPLLAAVGMFIKTPLGKSLMTSLAIHAGVLAVEFHNTASASPPANDAEKKLEVKLNPKDPLSTPPGWTAPVAPSVEPTPPTNGGSVVVQYRVSGSTGAWGTTMLQAAQLFCAANFANYASVWTGAVGEYRCLNTSGGMSGYLSFNTQNTCPVGYVVAGAVCTLSNAAVVQKPSDGKAEISRVGNVLYVDARDTADGLPPNVVATSDTVTMTDTNGAKYETHINADGTSTVTSTIPRTDGSNKSDRVVTALSAPDPATGAVEVTGASSQVYSGTGAAIAGTPDAATGSSDAKDSTLQAIKASIDAAKAADAADRSASEAGAAALPGQLTGSAASGQFTVSALGLPSQSQFGVADVTGVGAALPSNNGDCVALDVELPQMGNLHISPCAVVNAVRPLVDFLMVALGCAGGLFVLLGRREE